ncbi:Fanconi anemia group M protein isoform X1 [Pieris napi]|uniref:Fanconi anemia group M protein isoform X1 n=1 Tax=Pieris napi TaxID=78633 RepID=UPI001FB9C042|nr:Fanconi anemia group M protein isoform X1 [Pieris napi]
MNINKRHDTIEIEDVFDDSALLANFENSAFREDSFSDRNANKSLNVSALCCDEEINGYDRLTGKTWIYPTNYPVRDYQFNIIQSAIVKNTLVSLPTGLGKTFIAAVIMYNFYRWYPLGKIVFTAPTRPLVAQQIEACYSIVALPPKDTIEMTGHMRVSTRKEHWLSKRVFFATPQVIYNDIKSGICPGESLRCLVVDEAHRARGNYAYCQIVSTLADMGHKTYRVLALSATPGSKVEDVVNVVKNLNIAHLELRTENCIDVAPYSHSRKINTVIIQLGPELTHLRQQYVEILDGYARRLKQLNILPHNLGNLSKGRVVMLYKEFQTRDKSARHPQHNIIMKDFTLLIALYHGLELLLKHGSRVFLNFFDEHPEKSWIQSDDKLTSLLERLRDDLGINPLSLDRSVLPDGTVPEMPKHLTFGHPKFYKLKEIMLEHFQKAKKKGETTKAIVFCEYRESVNLVHCMLLQCRPLIVPLMFVGQGASGKDGKTVVSQKQQLRVMRSFREGSCNTLVCTCVAEEGLDVGSVDLIICFDISTRSPIRLVQRCGRTGRERGGQVHILVTEGREHQTLIDCMRQRDGLNTRIQQSKEVENSLYKSNPRMIPHDFRPQCQKMHITVPKKCDPDKTKKGQKDLRSMLQGRPSTSSSNNTRLVENDELIHEDEFDELFPDGFKDVQRLSDSKEYWNMNKEAIIESSNKEGNRVQLHNWLEWQRTKQTTINIGHSMDTDILISLLKYSDDKRFDAPPSTQNPTFNTQDFETQNIKVPSPAKPKPAKKKLKPTTKSPIKKDGDIRALFSTATKSTKDYTKLLNDLGIQNDGKQPTSLINLLVDLKLEVTNNVKKCYICTNICDCTVIANAKNKQKAKPLLFLNGIINLPDINLIDSLNTETILKCSKTNKNEVSDNNNSMDELQNESENFKLDFDFDLSESPKEGIKSEAKTNVNNFDIGDIDDIFENSSPEEAGLIEIKKEEKPKEALGFFGLESIEDIFADSDEELTNQKELKEENKVDVHIAITSDDDDCGVCEASPTHTYKNHTKIRSPSLLSGTLKLDLPTSPILGSQPRKLNLSTKKNKLKSSTPLNSRKKLLLEPETIDKHMTIENDSKCVGNVSETSNSKSMFTITQLVDMINKTNNSTINKSEIPKERSLSPILLTQADRKLLKTVTQNTTLNSKPESLIILESDSDDNAEEYNAEVESINILNEPKSEPQKTIKNEINDFFQDVNKNRKDLNNTPNSSKTPKRKMENDDEIIASPYFSKRRKLDEQSKKSLMLREKVLAVISSNNFNTNKDKQVNYFTCSQKFSQKENEPVYHEKHEHEKSPDGHKMLQMFRKDTPRKINFAVRLENSGFDDSDDDFVGSDRTSKEKRKIGRSQRTPNHKARKKKRNEFLDLEAEISSGDSGDELSEDSAGSLVEFIDDAQAQLDTDMQAHYIRSVKSPVNGVFKIPQLPKKFNNEEIFSQFVEEDTYEMDSFCVDSHIGLTQANDMSELEIAEMILENKKRKFTKNDTIDSPIVRKVKKCRRKIDSDSDSS